jgi:hypothetical protein
MSTIWTNGWTLSSAAMMTPTQSSQGLAAVTIVRVKGLARAGSANRASRRAARPVRPATEHQGQLGRQGVKLSIG